MKMKGIPFIWQNVKKESEKEIKGFYPSLINYFKGVSLAIFNEIKEESKGMNIGYGNLIHRNCKGVNIGVVNNIGENSKGLNIGLGNMIYEDTKGVNIGLTNKIEGYSKGVAGGIINDSEKVDNYLIQIGIFNIIGEVNEKSIALQIGVYNKIDNQFIPLINLKGASNLTKKLKSCLKKKESLDNKI